MSPGYHTTRYIYSPKRIVVWKEICRWLNHRWIAPSARILELGCGYGDFIGNVNGKQKAAIEAGPHFAGYLAHYPDVAVHWEDVHVALPQMHAGSFDVVFASNFFEHFLVGDVQNLLHNVRRVLASTGRIIVMQPNYALCSANYFDDWTHRSVFSATSFADLLAASGFRVERSYPRFIPFSLKSRLPVHRLLVRLYLASPFRPLAAQFLIIATVDSTEQTFP